jgi:hypothetical protein
MEQLVFESCHFLYLAENYLQLQLIQNKTSWFSADGKEITTLIKAFATL